MLFLLGGGGFYEEETEAGQQEISTTDTFLLDTIQFSHRNTGMHTSVSMQDLGFSRYFPTYSARALRQNRAVEGGIKAATLHPPSGWMKPGLDESHVLLYVHHIAAGALTVQRL